MIKIIDVLFNYHSMLHKKKSYYGVHISSNNTVKEYTSSNGNGCFFPEVSRTRTENKLKD